MARPSGTVKEINWDLFELYLKSGAKQKKIAESLRIDEDTLRKRVKEKYGQIYSVISAAFHSEGDLLIEAQQFQKAVKGYWPALLWLGKVRLGQKEPDVISSIPPTQDQIDKDQIIMQLQHRLSVLEENGNQSKAE